MGESKPPLEPVPVVATNGATITYNANGGTGNIEDGFVAPLGNGFKGWNTQPDGSGTSYAPGAEVSQDLTLYAIWGGTYRLGQEVSIQVAKGTETVTESFYVIEDKGTSDANVTLLAKYNLDKNVDETTGKYYQKPNATFADTACAFSSTNYWATKWEAVDIGENGENITARRFDLNNEAEYGEVAEGDAIDRAKNYAKNTLDLTRSAGRLLTYEEAIRLENYYNYILFGDLIEGYLHYWLSSTFEENYIEGGIWWIHGDEEVERGYVYSGDEYADFGVRPVVTVPKTAINH
ncbi:MAG: InlB B-repeat-containing protein [Clostridia bacterium]|nr:InlB B-repeat-containing protein [Clostridia bacterium]